MSIDPAILRAMAEAGASIEVILAAVEAAKAKEDALLAEKRAKAAAKKARQRAAKRPVVPPMSPNVPGTSGDTSGQPGTSGDLPSDGSPQEIITQPPSLPPHSSDADASALPADSASAEVSVNDQIWNSKAALADLSGKSEASVGKWIGKALKDHPPDVVKQGIDAALLAGTRDPFSYARSVMLNNRGTQNGQQGNRNGRTHSAAQPRGTASRLAAIMGYDPEPEVHGSEEERRVPDRDTWPKGRHASGYLDAEPDAAGVYRA
jgi:hypothetical protein